MTRFTLNSVFLLITVLFSISTYAAVIDEAEKGCYSEWVKHSSQAKNAAQHKKFGKEYCSCVAIDVVRAFKKGSKLDARKQEDIAGTCIMASVLHETAKNYNENDKLSVKQFKNDCQKLFSQIVFDTDSSEFKKISKSFCVCSAPKVVKVWNVELSDDAFDRKLDNIADDCIDKIS